jgi:hypothetical protein
MPTAYQVSPIDIGILVGYVILSRLIPLWLVRGKTGDAQGFFLGGRNFVWPLVGFSLFATNMSGASSIGLAGAGYSQGVSVYSYEWMAAIILIIFIFFILPFYLRADGDRRLLAVVSVSEHPQRMDGHRLRSASPGGRLTDLVSGTGIEARDGLELPPYGFVWLVPG